MPEQDDEGIVVAIFQRLENEVIPRALDLKRLVDAGATLSHLDRSFLDRVLQGLREDGPYVRHHPDWEPLYSRVVDLCDQITRRALANENRLKR